MTQPAKDWSPPYCANDTDLKCPKCGEESVCVREKEVYFEGECEVYCGECHADLEVQVSVTVEFSEPEAVE